MSFPRYSGVLFIKLNIAKNLTSCISTRTLYNQSMTTEIIIAIISGIVAVLVAVISKTELFSRKHYGIRKDVELYQLLPDQSTKKNDLMKYIDKRVSDYIIRSAEHKRNGTEITIGLIFLPIGAYLTWFFYSLGSWWLIGLFVSGSLLVIGGYGIVNGLRKAERDEKGNVVPKK